VGSLLRVIKYGVKGIPLMALIKGTLIYRIKLLSAALLMKFVRVLLLGSILILLRILVLEYLINITNFTSLNK